MEQVPTDSVGSSSLEVLKDLIGLPWSLDWFEQWVVLEWPSKILSDLNYSVTPWKQVYQDAD